LNTEHFNLNLIVPKLGLTANAKPTSPSSTRDLGRALGFQERLGTALAKVTSACANQDIGGDAMTED
jgi:hypothetical protein